MILNMYSNINGRSYSFLNENNELYEELNMQ